MLKSIVVTVSGYALAQIGLIAILSHLGPVEIPETLGFTLFVFLVHVGLMAFLIRFKHYFTDQRTGLPFTRVNFANRVTLLRISSVPMVAFLLTNTEHAPIKMLLPIILIPVFLTDSFDGQIARKTNQITRIGQMLDSISDYGLLIVISVVYFRNGIVPTWFFTLIFLRLFLQALGMLVFLMLRKPVDAKSTWGGKIAIATIMALYVAEIIRMYLPPQANAFFRGLEYAAGAIVFLSYFEKFLIFFRHSKK